MNALDTLSNLVSWLLEKLPFIQKPLNGLANALFPEFLRIPFPVIIKKIKLSVKEILKIYSVVFLFVFIIQGLWAINNGRFFPDSDPTTRNFLEDWPNLINYVFIVEAYVILGILFLNKLYKFQFSYDTTMALIPGKNSEKFNLSKGYLGLVILLSTSLIGSALYAEETKLYTNFYWFMKTGPPDVSFSASGYYYFFMGLLLLMIIIWVALAHFGLFQISHEIVTEIKNIKNSKSNELSVSVFYDENKWKERLAPFTELFIISRAFLLVLTVNMYTWMSNDTGLTYKIAVSLIILLGLWFFSLPRYQVQYHIYKAWDKIGKYTYIDLRKPWMIGISALIDVIIFFLLANFLLPDIFGQLINMFYQSS